MKKIRLLDSYALLAYLKKEDNHQRVAEMLSSGSYSVIMNELNIGESYYILARERGIESAEYFIETVLPNLPVEIISNSFEHIIDASRVKAKHPISYCDCFAVVTAMRERAVIVTGAPDFKMLEHIVGVEWL